MTTNQRRPWQSPQGWVPLADAFIDHLFMSAFGSSWAGRLVPSEIEAAIAERALSPWLKFAPAELPSDIRGELKGVDAARFYSFAICDYINRAVRSDRLRTAFKPKGAGALEPMPLAAWQTDHAFLRFDGWAFDPDNYSATGRDLPCWVFVEASDLAALEAELGDWRERLPLFIGGQGADYFEASSFMLGSPVSIRGEADLFIISCPRLPVPPPALCVVGGGEVLSSKRPAEEPERKHKATRAEVQAWIVERIKAGDSQTEVCDAIRAAFAGKVVQQNREQVREMYRAEYQAIRGELVRPGPRAEA